MIKSRGVKFSRGGETRMSQSHNDRFRDPLAMIVPFSVKAHRTLAHIMLRGEKLTAQFEVLAGYGDCYGVFPACKAWAGNLEAAPGNYRPPG